MFFGLSIRCILYSDLFHRHTFWVCEAFFINIYNAMSMACWLFLICANCSVKRSKKIKRSVSMYFMVYSTWIEDFSWCNHLWSTLRSLATWQENATSQIGKSNRVTAMQLRYLYCFFITPAVSYRVAGIQALVNRICVNISCFLNGQHCRRFAAVERWAWMISSMGFFVPDQTILRLHNGVFTMWSQGVSGK